MYNRETDINEINNRINRIHDHTGVYKGNLKDDLNVILDMCRAILERIQDHNVYKTSTYQDRLDTSSLREIAISLIYVFSHDCNELQQNSNDKIHFETRIGSLYNDIDYESRISSSNSQIDPGRERAKQEAAHARSGMMEEKTNALNEKPDNSAHSKKDKLGINSFFSKASDSVSKKLHPEKPAANPQQPKMKK